MIIKALTGFAGVVSMFKGEEKDIDDKIALDLVRAGYAVACDPPKPKPRTKKTK